MTDTIGPPFLGQVAIPYDGNVDYCIAHMEVEGCHELAIIFPNMWKAMAYRQFVMRSQVMGIPAMAKEADLPEEADVTSVARPVTLRVVSNPQYAEAIFSAYYGAQS